MTYESLEVVELGKAEVAIELGPLEDTEEDISKFTPAVAPYVEYDE